MRSTSAIVHQIVDRQHVSARLRDVLREVVNGMHGRNWPERWRYYRSRSRAQRKVLMLVAFRRHKENQRLFEAVMSGRISTENL